MNHLTAHLFKQKGGKSITPMIGLRMNTDTINISKMLDKYRGKRSSLRYNKLFGHEEQLNNQTQGFLQRSTQESNSIYVPSRKS